MSSVNEYGARKKGGNYGAQKATAMSESLVHGNTPFFTDGLLYLPNNGEKPEEIGEKNLRYIMSQDDVLLQRRMSKQCAFHSKCVVNIRIEGGES